MTKWEKTVEYLKSNVKGFEVKEKDGVWHQELINKVLFFSPFMKVWSALYPKVWKPANRNKDFPVLQHEGTHLLDAQSFYGLLPVKPVLKWFNIMLFSICYAMPQLLFVLSLLAIGGNFWWLLFLLFLAPLPSPGRMMAEMRAYRRTRELGGDPELIANSFTKENYYYMWPFRKHVLSLLKKDSPYKKDMDKIINETIA